MLRALGVVLAALIAIPAAFAGGPGSLRVARPADVSPSAASPSETWHVTALDPRTKSSLLLTIDFLRNFWNGTIAATGAQLTYWPTVPQTGDSEIFHDLGVASTAGPGVAVRGVSLSYAGGRWTLALDQGATRLQLVLTHPRPGVTATQWPVGQVTSPGSPHYLATFDWSSPVATARADGFVEYSGRHVDLAGWRASIDHTWGKFDFGSGMMQHWDWAALQDASGGWLVDGFETGPGITQWKPHDAQWSGVLVHATAGKTTFCRASVVRGGWTEFYAGVNGYVYPHTLRASCGGSRVAIARLKNAFDYEHSLASSAASTSSGGYGLFFEWEPTG